tara:strand:+ start:78 stop:344 length:267 start_codon:yes stop_codon:yes gene_type:complete
MFLLIAVSTLFIGSVVIAILRGIGESLYEKAYNCLYPRPALSEEEMTEILHEAAEFVNSKHRPWDYDDGFAEYLSIVHELGKDRNYLK